MDDRPPTFYFKFKTHKADFKVQQDTPGIFLISQNTELLSKFTRPIVSHKPSITTLASSHLRPLITPIISNSPVEDVLEVTNLLFFHKPPAKLYCYDIIKFYPSTPHDLIIESFKFYNPTSTMLPLLKSLLTLNYVTNGTQIFTHGTLGIPMGLPLAPELSRMVTAYLLRDYIPPPGEILTLYFDDKNITSAPIITYYYSYIPIIFLMRLDISRKHSCIVFANKLSLLLIYNESL